MTKDLSIGIIDLQTAKQGYERMLLSWGSGVSSVAVGIKASFVADADGMGVVATGMGSYHLFGPALVDLAVLGDVIVVAGGLVAPGLVAGDEGFQGKVLSDFGRGTMTNYKIYTAHNFNDLEPMGNAGLHGDGSQYGCNDCCYDLEDLLNG